MNTSLLTTPRGFLASSRKVYLVGVTAPPTQCNCSVIARIKCNFHTVDAYFDMLADVDSIDWFNCLCNNWEARIPIFSLPKGLSIFCIKLVRNRRYAHIDQIRAEIVQDQKLVGLFFKVVLDRKVTTLIGFSSVRTPLSDGYDSLDAQNVSVACPWWRSYFKLKIQTSYHGLAGVYSSHESPSRIALDKCHQ